MKASDCNIFRCLACDSVGRWELDSTAPEPCAEVTDGTLRCQVCGTVHPILRCIPRFVGADNYAGSFGYQWNKFAKVQVGGAQTAISSTRFFATSQWPDDLSGQVVLEAGCGAGRFTGIVLATGAEVYSFDLSLAVEANLANVQDPAQKARLHLFQASIYDIPLPIQMFDKVYCLGVLQHCPDVKGAFFSLTKYLKPGGEIVIDCYLSQPLKHAFNLKYWLRPFFRWWKPSWLYAFWSRVISVAFEVKSLVNRLPLLGPRLARLIPIGRLSYEPEHSFTVAQMKEIKTLSVFDMLSPRYDKPQKLSSFKQWAEEAGLELLHLGTGYNGINLRARKSALTDSTPHAPAAATAAPP